MNTNAFLMVFFSRLLKQSKKPGGKVPKIRLESIGGSGMLARQRPEGIVSLGVHLES